jgi:putative exosortase-associated protein (TIGR04073 family)
MKSAAAILAILLIVGAGTACSDTLDGEYTAQDKFTRSIVNFFTCWMEIPLSVHEVSVNENPVMGVLYGIPLGLGKAAVRIGTAALEFVTFPVPPFEPMVDPEYLVLGTNK